MGRNYTLEVWKAPAVLASILQQKPSLAGVHVLAHQHINASPRSS